MRLLLFLHLLGQLKVLLWLLALLLLQLAQLVLLLVPSGWAGGVQAGELQPHQQQCSAQAARQSRPSSLSSNSRVTRWLLLLLRSTGRSC